MTNATEAKATIAGAVARAAALEEEIEHLTRRREELLAALPLEPKSYEDKKNETYLGTVEAKLAQARAELQRLTDHAEVLRSKLPGEAEVAEANEKVSDLLESADDYDRNFTLTWRALLDALAMAGELATDAVLFRQQHSARIREAAALVSQMGIEGRTDVPRFSRTGPERLSGSRDELELACGLLDVVRSATDGSLEADGAAVARVADAMSRIGARESEAA